MKKAFFVWTLLLALLNAGYARADFEAVETVLGKLEDVQKEAQNVQEELKKVQAGINAARQGDFGPLKEVKSNILNDKKINVKMIGPIAEKVGDVKELEGAVEENMIPNYTDKDQDATFFVNKDTTDAIRRESLSRMYAYALVLRVNMEEARTKGQAADKPVTAGDSREILQSAATKEAMENARRYAHIWDMQSAIYELQLIEKALLFSNKDKGESGNSAAEGDEK